MNNIIEIFKNPKKKALVQLAFYAVFFAFVFIVLGISNSNNNYTNNYQDNNIDNVLNTDNDKINSYSYVISIDDEVIMGTYFNDTSIFTYKDNNYYIENNLVYAINNDSYYLSHIEYDIVKILNINELIENREEYSTTTYKDGKKISNYILSSNDFYSFYYGNTPDSLFDIFISAEKINDVVTYVEITNINSDINTIKIEYSDINEIESLNFNKENYTYGE